MGSKPGNVDYQDRYRKKAPSRADHLRQYWWKKGQSGRDSVGRLEEIRRKAEVGEELTSKERSLLNLRPQTHSWKKGQSGNPKGNPTGTLLSPTAQLKAYLRRAPEEVVAVIEAWLKESKRGNMVAIKEVLERIDGKIVETHKIEGELPIKLIFMPAQVLLGKEEFKELEDVRPEATS